MPTQPWVHLDNVYRIVTKKQDSGGTVKWVNTYDLETFPLAPFSDLDAFMAAIGLNESHWHYPDVHFIEALAYKWEVGPNPAGPQPPVRVASYGFTGDNTVTDVATWSLGDYVDGQLCLFTRKLRLSGQRDGKNYYRGCLREGDVTTTGVGGKTRLTLDDLAAGHIRERVTFHLVNALSPYLGTAVLGTPQVGIVHTHKVGGVIVSADFGGISGATCDGVRSLDKTR